MLYILEKEREKCWLSFTRSEITMALKSFFILHNYISYKIIYNHTHAKLQYVVCSIIFNLIKHITYYALIYIILYRTLSNAIFSTNKSWINYR